MTSRRSELPTLLLCQVLEACNGRREPGQAPLWIALSEGAAEVSFMLPKLQSQAGDRGAVPCWLWAPRRVSMDCMGPRDSTKSERHRPMIDWLARPLQPCIGQHTGAGRVDPTAKGRPHCTVVNARVLGLVGGLPRPTLARVVS